MLPPEAETANTEGWNYTRLFEVPEYKMLIHGQMASNACILCDNPWWLRGWNITIAKEGVGRNIFLISEILSWACTVELFCALRCISVSWSSEIAMTSYFISLRRCFGCNPVLCKGILQWKFASSGHGARLLLPRWGRNCLIACQEFRMNWLRKGKFRWRLVKQMSGITLIAIVTFPFCVRITLCYMWNISAATNMSAFYFVCHLWPLSLCAPGSRDPLAIIVQNWRLNPNGGIMSFASSCPPNSSSAEFSLLTFDIYGMTWISRWVINKHVVVN